MRETLARLYRGDTNIDFIGRRKLWFALSGTVLLICVVTLATRGLNFGIEFEGGLQMKAAIPEDGPLGEATDLEVNQQLREALERAGAGQAQIQVASGDEGRTVLVQTKQVQGDQAEEIKQAVSETVGAPITDSSEIGQKWGEEITGKAIRALVIFVLVVLAFISWRFEWKMAIAAVLALIHDLLITAGIYSLVGFEVSPSTVIAILTILGYSLYDTVVVFDKVEEDTVALAASGRTTYQDAANVALNEVFMRSLNTSLTTLLPVAALLFVGAGLLGAETLKDLALALLVGLLAGTYSSVFFATPILTMMKEREPRYRGVRERVLRDARRAGVAPRPVARGAGAAAEPASVGVASRSPDEVSRPTSVPRAPSRAPVGTKKARRRKRR